MMNLTPFGVGLASAIVLPASSSAQAPEKAVVEPAPAVQRARPTAAPTAAPTSAPTVAAPAKGTIQAQPGVLKVGDDDDDDLQARPSVLKAGDDDDDDLQARPSVLKAGDDDDDDLQARPSVLKAGDDDDDDLQARPSVLKAGDDDDDDLQARPSVLKAGDDDDDDIQAQPGVVGKAPGQTQVPVQAQPGLWAKLRVRARYQPRASRVVCPRATMALDPHRPSRRGSMKTARWSVVAALSALGAPVALMAQAAAPPDDLLQHDDRGPERLPRFPVRKEEMALGDCS